MGTFRLKQQPVQALQRNVSREEALQAFQTLWSRAMLGPLQSAAEVHVPFRVFRVRVGGRPAHYFGMDLVNGTLDLYSFYKIPETHEQPAANLIPSRLEQNAAQALLLEKARRVIYQKGFFRHGAEEIAAETAVDVAVPYWAGFYGNPERLKVRVMDAVRRRFEGAKLQTMLLENLSER